MSPISRTLHRIASTTPVTSRRSIAVAALAPPAGSRGLCRMMLRTANSNNAGPAPPSAADMDTFYEMSKSAKPPKDAFDLCEDLTSEAALAELRRKSKKVAGPPVEQQHHQQGSKHNNWNTFHDVDPFSGEPKSPRGFF